MSQPKSATGRTHSNEHLLQLFDSQESLAQAVSTYLYAGWREGAQLLVIAKPRHWTAIGRRLLERGCPVPELLERGQITVLDARGAASSIAPQGVPDPSVFEQTLGPHVARAATHPGGLRIYGEIVELLAEEGHVDGARRVEAMWNDLRDRYGFTLFCGYSSAHFADPAQEPALRAIREAHTRVLRDRSDILARWVLGNSATAE